MDAFRVLRTDSLDAFLAVARDHLADRGDMGRTLLHEALAHGKHEAALALIAFGADLDATDNVGRTPLHYCALFSDAKVASEIMASGGNVNAIDKFGNNPLWSAVMNPKISDDVLKVLVENGSDIDQKNKSGRSVRDMIVSIDDNNLSKLVLG